MFFCCYVISPGFVMECTISTEKMFENKPQVTIWVVKDPLLYGIGYNKRKLFRNSRDRAPSSTSPCVLSPTYPMPPGHAESWRSGLDHRVRSIFVPSSDPCLATQHCSAQTRPLYTAQTLLKSHFILRQASRPAFLEGAIGQKGKPRAFLPFLRGLSRLWVSEYTSSA